MKGRLLTGADGSVLYLTIDGDTVDQVAHDYYGKHERHTEEIYNVNPGLADMNIILPAGVLIKLPAVQKQETPKPHIRLWD